jgi:small-conductance mechanosensitive channel
MGDSAMRFMEQVYWGNPLSAWTTALAVMAGAVVVLVLARGIIVGRLRKVAARTRTDIDDAAAEILKNTRLYFLLALSVKFAANFVALPDSTHHGLSVIVTLALIVQGGIWGNTLIAFWFTRKMKARMEEDAAATTSLAVIKFIGRLVLWTVLLLVALGSVGVNITAFITTLGVGGIAVALALQNILGDLFASLSIVFDKPFVVGDTIVVGEHQGTVEHIGIKTTRLRSLGGEQIIISNSELSTTRIRNFRRMEERRVFFKVGVVYGTPPDVVEKIPGMIGEIIAGIPGTRFERAHFLQYGDYSLVFEVVYHVQSPEYLEYARIHEAVNIAILRRFRQNGIEFAYPTQRLHIER